MACKDPWQLRSPTMMPWQPRRPGSPSLPPRQIRLRGGRQRLRGGPPPRRWRSCGLLLHVRGFRCVLCSDGIEVGGPTRVGGAGLVRCETAVVQPWVQLLGLARPCAGLIRCGLAAAAWHFRMTSAASIRICALLTRRRIQIGEGVLDRARCVCGLDDVGISIQRRRRVDNDLVQCRQRVWRRWRRRRRVRTRRWR